MIEFVEVPAEKKEKKADGWSQANEVEFIRLLGTHSEGAFSRKELLEGYIKAHPMRSRWLGIKADKMLDFARRQLVEEVERDQRRAA